MGFRTLEIRRPAELHVTMGQLTIEQEEGKVMIPLEDLTTIVCIGSNIRLSTLGMAQMARCGITVLMIDTTYKPAAVLLPVESNARQALVMQKQISLSAVCKSELWQRIIRKKIENQARTLRILGLPGAEEVLNYVADLSEDNIDYTQALAAKRYFSYYHPGLNRRNDDSINSRLNYGYGVVRNAIIRAVVLAGFQTAFGLHHCNQLNAFNLADDLIEPWRPFVDLIAYASTETNIMLTKKQRYELAHVLHNACIVDGKKMTVLSGIDIMVESLKNAVINETTEIILPIIIPVESLELINE